MLSREALETLVIAEHGWMVGQIITRTEVDGYLDDDSVTWYAPKDQPFRVVVQPTPPHWGLLHWVDEWLDPYWDVIPADDETRLDGLSSPWVYGTSYSTTGQKEEAS